ncbi:hypothetical protein ACFU5O_05220 [Streptomyces sp. NPDC057445]|uniref:hypothetical protein n=1 Tax=Streptomyces sp. NPDC057445 TaxID=3346136 RepID=UPI00369A029B
MTRTTRTSALNTGLGDFLAWAEAERGAVLPPRPADAVLTLLALRGADRRAGVPEPTPELVRRVLFEDLPLLLHATADELAAVPSVLTALADRVRAANRLNAKRHERLLAAVQDALHEFGRAMNDPRNLTWHRWYASLMRADGVDADDARAVRDWLAALDASAHEERPGLPSPLHRSDVTAATFAAGVRLTEALLGAFARDVEGPTPSGPLLPATPALSADRPEEALTDELEGLAADLTDRWTAAGLSAALSGPYEGLAPGPEALPHVVLADRLLDEHLDYYGDPAVPLPPPAVLPSPDEIKALLHIAPLPAALAAGSDDAHELAELCGFPGPAAAVWTGGTPGELTELAADILAAEVERIAAGSGPDEEDALDAAHVLYALYERGCTPDSVARKASDHSDWLVAPELEDAPVRVPDTAPAAYTTPTPAELSDLLGLPGLTEDDRTELDGHARALAAVIDRLAGTGCVFRTGDTYGLTPLGGAVLRHVLAVGHVAAPDDTTASTWDAAGTVAAVQHWPEHIAAVTLKKWAEARGGTEEVWSELLEAASAGHPSIGLSDTFDRLARAGIPAPPLRAALSDPVTAAYARRTLSGRGEDVPWENIPPTARATLVLDELSARAAEDMRAFVDAAAEDREPARAPTALLDAFDRTASDWPGGASALLTALAGADPSSSLRVLEDLRDRHPEIGVADLASHAAKTARAAGRSREGGRTGKRRG